MALRAGYFWAEDLVREGRHRETLGAKRRIALFHFKASGMPVREATPYSSLLTELLTKHTISL
jgi:hypothetical protein